MPGPPPTVCHTRTRLFLPWGVRPPLSARHSNKSSWFFVPPKEVFRGQLPGVIGPRKHDQTIPPPPQA